MLLYRLFALVLSFFAILIAGCGYHLSSTTAHVPNELKTIIFHIKDPYGQLARAVRSELRLNGITIVDDDKAKNAMLPSLRIVSSLAHQNTASLFPDGNTAEYQMMLSVHAKFLMPGQYYYPIDVKVYRSFFNNSRNTLAKDAEINIIHQEMFQLLSQQLVHQLLSLEAAIEADNNLLNTKFKPQPLSAQR